MNKHINFDGSDSLPGKIDATLSMVVFGSLLGCLEGYWKLIRDGLPGLGKAWLLGQIQFVLLALFLYGLIFGAFGAISSILAGTFIPKARPAVERVIKALFVLSFFLLFYNILMLFSFSSRKTWILTIGGAAFIVFVLGLGNLLVRQGKEDKFIFWMGVVTAELLMLFAALRLYSSGVYWAFTYRPAKVFLVVICVAVVFRLLWPYTKGLLELRWRFPYLKRVVLALFTSGLLLWVIYLAAPFLGIGFPLRNIRPRWLSFGPDRPNVILIVVDTLRADHLGLYGYHKRVSPYIDKWAKDGFVFEQAVSPSSWTLPSTVSLLSSRLPQSHGVHLNQDVVEPILPMIPYILSEEGYLSAAFIANEIISKRSDFPGFFDMFDGDVYGRNWVENIVERLVLTRTVHNDRLRWLFQRTFSAKPNTIDHVNKAVGEWLSVYRDYPFFLYLHYIDPHDPYYENAEWFKKNIPPGDPFINGPIDGAFARSINNYDREIRFTDYHLNQLFLKLQQMGIWDNSLVILTSDHGEAFGEHNNSRHGNTLYQEEVHVPLIVFPTKRFSFSGRYSPFVSTLDIAPTILDLLGVRKEIDADGQSLVSILKNTSPPLVRDIYNFLYKRKPPRTRFHAIYSKTRWKQVTTLQPPGYANGILELYDLEVDHAEKTNLVEDRPMISRVMAEKHARHENDIAHKKITPRRRPVSKRLKKALRTLGYIN